MHFQVIKDREYNHIVELLIKEVPEFNIAFNINLDDGEYIIFGDFASFIKENIRSKNRNLVVKSFDFINRSMDLPDIEVQNLIEVQIFESLTENENYACVAKELLRGKALERYKYIESIMS